MTTQGYRCTPGCTCGRHTQYRWRGTSAEQRFLARVQKIQGGCWLWTGSLTKGYGALRVNGKNTLAHRFSFEMANGPIPAGMVIDHHFECPKNCVNPDHLRLATTKQNMENRGHAYSNTGLRGVFRRKNGSYEAHVTHNWKRLSLGTFKTADEANRAVVAKRNELFSHNQADRVEHGK